METKQNQLSERLLTGGGEESLKKTRGGAVVRPYTNSSGETKTNGEAKTRSGSKHGSEDFSGAPESNQANQETFFHAPAQEKEDLKTPCKEGFRIVLVCLSVLPTFSVFVAALIGKFLLNYDVSLVGMCKSLVSPLVPLFSSFCLLHLRCLLSTSRHACVLDLFIN